MAAQEGCPAKAAAHQGPPRPPDSLLLYHDAAGKLVVDIKLRDPVIHDATHRRSTSTNDTRVRNLVSVLDDYFEQGGPYLNVNVLNKEMLEDAMRFPERYPRLIIRVSGYVVQFNRLSSEQRREIFLRTFNSEP